MRKLAAWPISVSLGLCVAMSACTSGGSESGDVPVSVVGAPFDDCVKERQPAEKSPRMLLETDQVEASGEIAFEWAPDVEGSNPDLGVYCWTGQAWKLVWFVRGYAGNGRVQLVMTEADNLVNNEQAPAVPGDLVVPAKAPPGWYRAGGGPNGTRGADFEVIASEAADR